MVTAEIDAGAGGYQGCDTKRVANSAGEDILSL